MGLLAVGNCFGGQSRLRVEQIALVNGALDRSKFFVVDVQGGLFKTLGSKAWNGRVARSRAEGQREGLLSVNVCVITSMIAHWITQSRNEIESRTA